MIIRYGNNEHGAIDADFIVHIEKPNKCTLIHDKFGKVHAWESTQFEHEYIMRKWIDFKNNNTSNESKENQYQYPMWFENIQDPTVLVKFTGLNTGVLLRCRSDFYNADKIDIECSDWTSHTVYKVWKQVDEPNLTDKEEK